MRAFSRRSLAQLTAPALLAIAACTPQLSAKNRPGPCPAELSLCSSTGLCVDPGEIDKIPAPGKVAVCPVGYTVRQGTSVSIAAPGARPNDVTIVQVAPDLSASVPVTDTDGEAHVDVLVPHGTVTGDHFVTFQAMVDGQAVVRTVLVVVSPIAVTSTGDDSAAGSSVAPFQTLKQAAAVATVGPTGVTDTIILSNGPNNTDAEPPTTDPVRIPSGVRLSGQDNGGTFIAMPLVLLGDVTIDNIVLEQRLTIVASGGTVSLNGTSAWDGVEVRSSAVATKLSIRGVPGIIGNDDLGHIPLLVSADQAKVTISEGTKVLFQKGVVPLETIRMEGDAQTLTIVESYISNAIGTIAITDLGAHNGDLISGGTTVEGHVNITGQFSVVQIMDAQLRTAQQLEGGILFQGASLDIESSQIFSGGIEQDNPASNVRVRSSRFSDYRAQGYHLIAGHADLGTSSDFGMNFFTSAFTPSGATALLIDSPDSPTSVLSMSNTTFDSTLPSPCTVHGPAVLKSVFDIVNHVGIDLY